MRSKVQRSLKPSGLYFSSLTMVFGDTLKRGLKKFSPLFFVPRQATDIYNVVATTTEFADSRLVKWRQNKS